MGLSYTVQWRRAKLRCCPIRKPSARRICNLKQLLVILPFDASGSSDDYGSNYFAHANERPEGMDTMVSKSSVNRHITTCRKLWPASIYDFEIFQRIDPSRNHDSGEIIRRAAGCTSWKRERQRSHNVYQRGVVRSSFDALECRRIGSVPLSVIGSWNCLL